MCSIAALFYQVIKKFWKKKMKWYEIILVFIVLPGAVNTAYQVFKIAELDARSRG